MALRLRGSALHRFGSRSASGVSNLPSRCVQPSNSQAASRHLSSTSDRKPDHAPASTCLGRESIIVPTHAPAGTAAFPRTASIVLDRREASFLRPTVRPYASAASRAGGVTLDREVSLVQGASRGIGLELARQLLLRSADSHVIATCRNPSAVEQLIELQQTYSDRLTVLPLDVTDEGSIEAASRHVSRTWGGLNLLINASGVLHRTGEMKPETSMKALTPSALLTCFQVNAMGPALVLKHMSPLLASAGGSAAGRPLAVAASISARVSSIGDNRLGGWHSYRASKTALNQLIRTMSIELASKRQPVAAILLHPGTVDTDMSRPFQRGVAKEKLFGREQAAQQLLAIIDGVTAEDNGKFYAWDGQEVPW